jgi:hypothetical protein
MLGSRTDDPPMRDPAGDLFLMEERTLKSGAEASMSEPTVEAPMETQTVQSTTRILAPKPCAHGRLIDNVLTRSGKPTGQVRCLECGTVLDDPHRVQR